jgi:hypothetical protein
MSKTHLLFLSIVIVILVSGCSTSQIPQDPKQHFKDLVKKSQTLPNGKFTYKFTMGMDQEPGADNLGGFSALFGNLAMDIDVYSLNGDTKTLMTISFMGMTITSAQFVIDGKTTLCTETPESFGGSGGVQCVESSVEAGQIIESEQFTELFEKSIDLLTITYNGENQYGERSCYEFLITVDENTLESLMSDEQSNTSLTSQPFKDTKAEYLICMDKQFGFATFFDLKFLKHSELANKEIETLKMSMELKSFDPNGASPSDLVIPEEA